MCSMKKTKNPKRIIEFAKAKPVSKVMINRVIWSVFIHRNQHLSTESLNGYFCAILQNKGQRYSPSKHTANIIEFRSMILTWVYRNNYLIASIRMIVIIQFWLCVDFAFLFPSLFSFWTKLISSRLKRFVHE